MRSTCGLVFGFLLLAPGAAQAQNALKELVDRAEARMAREDWDGAIADYTHALEVNPGSPDLYSNRGLALKHKGEYARASALNP